MEKQPPPPAAPQLSGAWLTVKPEMKAILDRLDRPDQPAIFGMVSDDAYLSSFLPTLQNQIRPEGLGALGLSIKQFEAVKTQLNQQQAARLYGFGLRGFSENRLSAVHALELTSDGVQLVKPLLPGSAAPQQPGQPPVVQPPGPGQPGTNQLSTFGSKDDTVVVSLEDKYLTVSVNLPLREEEYNRGMEGLRSLMIYLRGEAEMVNTQTKIFELASATQAFLKANGHFPRGTLPQPENPDLILPVPPQKRLSWMVELLPFLADGEYKRLPLKMEKSWKDRENLLLAQLVIPEFIVRGPRDITPYRVVYPGMTQAVAATHFVGIAGVGMNAPSYNPRDPAVAKKLGIFGYDRVTRKEDITDGLDKTILLIQVPLDHKAPWMAGGGSTVRGVSDEETCFKPFLCAEYKGKKGTFAIMADGKVRFLAEDKMTPAIFNALCTIAGDEKNIPDIDKIAPEIDGKVTGLSELRTMPPPASTRPAPPTTPAPPATPPGAPATGSPRP